MTLRGEWLAAIFRVNHLAHDLLFLVEVHKVDELQNGVRTHATLEELAVAELHFTVENFILDDLAAVQSFERVEGCLGQLALFGVATPDGLEFLLRITLQRLEL